MRLWHEELVPFLPRQQLLGQHRECCALRGKGWGKKHATVDYVFEHPFCWLVIYHFKVMNEMLRRGYHVNESWYSPYYRGKNCDMIDNINGIQWDSAFGRLNKNVIVYPEHDVLYLGECLHNLYEKGIEIKIEKQRMM